MTEMPRVASKRNRTDFALRQGAPLALISKTSTSDDGSAVPETQVVSRESNQCAYVEKGRHIGLMKVSLANSTHLT